MLLDFKKKSLALKNCSGAIKVFVDMGVHCTSPQPLIKLDDLITIS